MNARDREHGDSSGSPFRRHNDPDDSHGAGNEAPVDLAAVQADDALLDRLGAAALDLSDATLARVLTAWRRDVDAEPIGELVDTATATAAITAARRPPPRHHPVLGPLAAAAAVAVITLSGLGLAAASAQPGDRLWPLTSVLYADYARSLQAAIAVRAELVAAAAALAGGDTPLARRHLDQARVLLPRVDEEQGRAELTARHDELQQLLTTTQRR